MSLRLLRKITDTHAGWSVPVRVSVSFSVSLKASFKQLFKAVAWHHAVIILSR
jgi:hypothetical protein